MKRLRVVGLCLVATFAFGSTLAANASAASPEYLICAKATEKGKGDYEDKACSKAVPGTGNYERVSWEHAKKFGFKAKNSGTPHNNIVNPFGKGRVVGEPGQIEGTTSCETAKATGEVTGSKTNMWTMKYSKCSALETKCNTAGQKEGTIVSEVLTSELVWLDKAHTKVGIKVKGSGPNGLLTQYECLHKALNVEVFGELLAEIRGDVGQASKSSEILAGEGPLHLQGVGGPYVEEPFGSPESDEQAAKRWWEYHEAILACEAGKEPFPAGSHSELECETFIGHPNPIAIRPTLLESVVTGAKEGVAPGIQSGIGDIKGEAFLIA